MTKPEPSPCPRCGCQDFDARTNSGRILGLECCACGFVITGDFGRVELEKR
jgi:Zn ribbon nucleic-acid-binding protein